MQKLEVLKWGNSAVIRLSKGLMRQIPCDFGTKFEVTVREGGIILKPIQNREYTLEELLKTCTKENTQLDDEDKAWLDARPRGEELGAG